MRNVGNLLDSFPRSADKQHVQPGSSSKQDSPPLQVRGKERKTRDQGKGQVRDTGIVVEMIQKRVRKRSARWRRAAGRDGDVQTPLVWLGPGLGLWLGRKDGGKLAGMIRA